MRVVQTIASLRAALEADRRRSRTVGFVPTMGYLHAGHASLIRQARTINDVVVVSIFVNPLQFGANEDLDAYPRDLEHDLKLCQEEGVDYVFTPAVQEMYGEPSPIKITTGALGQTLCGRTRPGHFDGVATVVAKLLNIVGPCTAYFGRKDAQQLVVIRRLVQTLNLPVTVIGCPTVRQEDGLALSSRNTYLNTEERGAAVVLSKALEEAASNIRGGETDARGVAALLSERISSEPLARLDYAACVDPHTLEDVERIGGDVLLAVAAWFGKARLIDNTTVTPEAGAPSGG